MTAVNYKIAELEMKLLSRDLRDGKEYPRSPRETLGAEVIAWNNKARQLRLSDLPAE